MPLGSFTSGTYEIAGSRSFWACPGDSFGYWLVDSGLSGRLCWPGGDFLGRMLRVEKQRGRQEEQTYQSNPPVGFASWSNDDTFVKAAK
jgi:hypothetical protein